MDMFLTVEMQRSPRTRNTRCKEDDDTTCQQYNVYPNWQDASEMLMSGAISRLNNLFQKIRDVG